MDITDIFDDEPKPGDKPAPKPELPADVVNTADLRSKAKEVADLHDAAAAKSQSYAASRQERIAVIDAELAHLHAEADEAAVKLDEARADLQKAMEEAGVNTISMPDRTPVKLKISPGRRKPISKKLLAEVYGKEKAQTVWEETEIKGPDKTTLVIPDPFEDEPDI